MGCGISKFDLDEVGGGFTRRPKRYTYPTSADTSTTTFLQKQPDLEDAESLDNNFDQKNESSTAMGANVGKVPGPGVGIGVGVGAGAGAGEDHILHAINKSDNEDMTRDGGIVREKGSDNNNNIIIDHVKVRVGDCHEDGRGSISGRDDSIACPGSPSFREYCVYNVSKNGRSSKNYEGRIGAKVENKLSQGEEYSLHKGQKTKVTKKKNQGNRKSGRSVKNLFTNATCYNPNSRSIPHDDP